MFTIETPRLLLRDILASDLKPFFDLGSDPEISYFQTIIRTATEDEAEKWLKGAIVHNKRIPREAYNLAIVLKQNEQWLGWIGIGRPSDETLGDLDFGYAMSKRNWGQGYMTEALRGLIDFSFRELSVNSIFGECEQENPGSARVMEKAGLVLESSFQKFDEQTHRKKNMLRFGISRSIWMKTYA
jgi:[ribosomal protein S5]-alanine N-acetyltransferase